MKRYKRLWVLVGVLCVACIATVAVSQYQEKKEEISVSGETILSIAADDIQSLSWEYEDQSFSFHREGEGWTYEGDETFPVSSESIQLLLEPFAELGAAFTIQSPEDLGQYGLDNPACTIDLSTGEESWTILLGDFSTMDSQRYLSMGDGNVYLVTHDPLEEFDAQLSELIDHDDLPYFTRANSIQFSGETAYSIEYQEESADTYREDDRYFTQQDGRNQPLDTSLVEGYLRAVSTLDLSDYVTYNATEEDLAGYGLDNPQLTVQIIYPKEDEEGNETEATFQLSVSRDPEELAAAQEAEEASAQEMEEEEASSQSSEEEAATEEETITAYVRVGESSIVYQITGEEYEALMAASYDDLRHREVLPAETGNLSQLDISLEGADYSITSEGEGEDRVYSYEEEELDAQELLDALAALEVDHFTSEAPTQKEEISLTVHLDLEGEPTVSIQLYRYDGDSCLAVVDGTSVGLVPREQVVDLIETVNAIVL